MNDDNHDQDADCVIRKCLDLDAPRSFFLYAGAGSGKTRSLEKAVKYLLGQFGRRLALRRQRIGVITYTNAACDEIRQRLEFDELVSVSTIHSFAWSLIKGFDDDIRNWLRQSLSDEILELEEKQAKGRESKASRNRQIRIAENQRRLDSLNEIRSFVYSATGDNRGRDALSHSEVIALSSEFLRSEMTMQRIVTDEYPVILVDESQDTHKDFMDSLLELERNQRGDFSLGLFGDMMQRIYGHGKADLEEEIPSEWSRPVKVMNHRCPGRIVRLINSIRSEVDDKKQRYRSDKEGGYVRLFLLRGDVGDRQRVESRVLSEMANLFGDKGWVAAHGVQRLALEHHMAARRLGFGDFFEALYGVERFRTGLLDGSLPGVDLFVKDVLPLADAISSGDDFQIMKVLRDRSEFLSRECLGSGDARKTFDTVGQALDSLVEVLSDGEGTLLQVLTNVHSTGLFEIPGVLRPYAVVDAGNGESDGPDDDLEYEAWSKALSSKIEQVRNYHDYVQGGLWFDTHQGVKGREFPRVMVVISDDEARGFLFNYEKLFGMKDKSARDLRNEDIGKETAVERTRRLFYVLCSRAQEGLAIILYCDNPDVAIQSLGVRGWFAPDEMVVIADGVQEE